MARARRKLVPPQPKMRGDSAQRLTSAFLDYLRGECRLADNTVAAYHRDITRFRHWLGNRSIAELKIADLSDFAATLHELKLAPASIARHIVLL